MLYKVKAKIIEESMGDFYNALTNKTIENQKPDGFYIHKAMKEALLQDKKTIVWYEACYCSTPFKHERQTVYDDYFYEFETTLVYEVKDDIRGDSFWDYLERNFKEEESNSLVS